MLLLSIFEFLIAYKILLLVAEIQFQAMLLGFFAKMSLENRKI
jgi:hypothetical protein